MWELVKPQIDHTNIVKNIPNAYLVKKNLGNLNQDNGTALKFHNLRILYDLTYVYETIGYKNVSEWRLPFWCDNKWKQKSVHQKQSNFTWKCTSRIRFHSQNTAIEYLNPITVSNIFGSTYIKWLVRLEWRVLSLVLCIWESK